MQMTQPQVLHNKVALVVGASRGIGKGIAVELGMAGAHVIVTGRSLSRTAVDQVGSLHETVAEITEAGGSAVAIRCDFADLDDVASLFKSVRVDHQHIDILVNSVFNAQEFDDSKGKRFWELPVDIWQNVVTVGTRSTYVSAVHAVPSMLGSGSSLIVNISGRGAERYMYNVAYGVGKAGIDKMTRDMAADLKAESVSVVSLWPNVTRTETLDAAYANDTADATDFGNRDLLETPRYAGRVIVALAVDKSLAKRSGKKYWIAELGSEYGLVDENGRSHPIPESGQTA